MTGVRRLYLRCNGGHLFDTQYCPEDGWTDPGFAALIELAATLEREGAELSIAALRARGATPAALALALVVDFGAPALAFHSATVDPD